MAAPIHDIKGGLFEKLWRGIDDLKMVFERMVISVTWPTADSLAGEVKKLEKDSFFEVIINKQGTVLCDHFLASYLKAVKIARKGQVIHLATIDRVLWQLIGHREEYLGAVRESEKGEAPIMYVRSDAAWKSHPKNYWAIEAMVSVLGEKLWGRYLDFFNCEVSIRREDLKKAVIGLDRDKNSFIFGAILVEKLWERWEIRKVDWLSWEDPYIFDRERVGLKKEREASMEEDRKRLGYVLPTIEWLLEKDKEKKGRI